MNAPRRAFDHVLIIMFENQYRSYMLENAYFRGLAAQGINMHNYFGVMHPSQTNYIASIAGELCNVSDDEVPSPLLKQRTIVDLIEESPYGLRWKAYTDFFTKLSGDQVKKRSTMFNAGVDVRHYLPIYRNIIWATRGAFDASWGDQKVVHYLGGVDGWLKFGSNVKSDGSYRYFEEGEANRPDPDVSYAFQTLAVNLRGFRQNIANGNNALVLNSEIRVPVFSTFFNRPINNAFLRNFQLVQFIDLGTAWNGKYDKIARPAATYGTEPLIVRIKAGGIGPLAGGYGFGARSTLLGYFIRFDAAWQMNGIFRGKPQTYFALGLDF
jgi:hypothetical protein